MTLYKWLTSDLTSHRDKRFKWSLDKLHVAPEIDPSSIGPQGKGLHVMKRPVDALRFGHWPGHLFEVEAYDPVAEDDFKIRCSSVQLVKELESTAIFGPRGGEFFNFLSWIKNIPWLQGNQPIKDAIEAANEYQSTLSSWGWTPVPVETISFDNWNEGSNHFVNAANPAATTGVWTAWAKTRIDWHDWVSPWAASMASSIGWASLEASAGATAWAVAKESWTGASPWPAPNDDLWKRTANSLRVATRIVAASVASDSARTAEYIVCGNTLPKNPFAPLMRIWMLGYWPMGVVDGKFLIADLSNVVGGDNAIVKGFPKVEELLSRYESWAS